MPIGELASLAAALSWAIGLMLFSRVLERRSSLETNFLKCGLATMMFWIAAVAFSPSQPLAGLGLGHLWLLGLSGAIGMALGDTLLFVAIRALGSARAMMLHATAPIFAALLAFAFAGETLGGFAIAGILLTSLGTAAVVSDRTSGYMDQDVPMLPGVVAGLGAALGQAIGLVIAREVLIDVGFDETPSLGVFMPVCAVRLSVSLVVLYLMLRAANAPRAFMRQAEAWREAVVPSFIGTFLGILLMVIGVSRTKSGIAGALNATTPIFLVLLSAAFLGHRYASNTVGGILIGVAGIFVLLLM